MLICAFERAHTDFMRVPKTLVLTGMLAGVEGIIAEFEHLPANSVGAAEARECLHYVLHEAAGSSDKLFGNSPFPRE